MICSSSAILVFPMLMKFVPRTQYSCSMHRHMCSSAQHSCSLGRMRSVPPVDEICSSDAILVPRVDEICSSGSILVPCVDEICSRMHCSCSLIRRHVFLRHNILVPWIDEMCSPSRRDLFLGQNSCSMCWRDLFLWRNILVPWVDDMCFSNSIFLFPRYMRSVPQVAETCSADAILVPTIGEVRFWLNVSCSSICCSLRFIYKSYSLWHGN
jgi:hypothetical protein